MKKSVLSVVLCVAMLFTLFAFGFTSVAIDVGTTYYVDSISGNDLNSGKSPDAAWASLAKANELTYSEGDKILLKAGGIYIAPFVAKGSGTAENPITVSSYGDIESDGKPMVFTNKDVELFKINNVSGWKIENLEMSAPNGMGVRITADNHQIMSDITVANCDMHDIYFKRMYEWGDHNRAPLFIHSYGENSRVDNVTFSGNSVYDCAYGIFTEGISVEGNPDIFVSPEVSHNQNLVFEDMSFYNIYYDAIIIRADTNVIVRNTSIINASLCADHFTAPMYMANSKNVLVENCEIAGATNVLDGMAVDFDGWTTDSTYQYVYSHDNVRFINNCVYDQGTRNRNNTVRYCLSVNDNKTTNGLAQLFGNAEYMENFKFYNNTIINGSNYRAQQLKDSFIANNIFYNDGDISQFYRTDCFGFDDDGKLIFRQFTGEFTNNCFFGCSAAVKAKNSVNRNPIFTGTDLTDPDSFRLAKNSPLIGKGIQVEEDMGERDFYGNPLTDTHNIGCYDGPGVDVEAEKAFGQSISDFFTVFAGYIVGTLMFVIELFR